jgi:hypothetical protein
MKKIIPVIAALALLLTFSGDASAQEDELSAKNLYLSYGGASKRGRPGVKIIIELKRDGVRQTVPLNYTFRAGDKVKFHFETNFNAYVKVINIGSTGDPQLLYPYRGAAEYVARTRDYSIPQGDLWFEFDRNPGAEQLTFVFSSQPLLTGAKNQNRPERPQNSEQQALAGLNSASLENGKNLTLVQDSQGNEHSAYGVATTQAVRKPIGVRINLRHQ